MCTSTVDTANILNLVEATLKWPANFLYNSETTPFTGGEHVLYILQAGPQKICLRVQKFDLGLEGCDLSRQEVELRLRIEQAGIQNFGSLFHADPTVDNVLKRPYMILQWVDGSPLKWEDARPARDEDRKKIIRAVANANVDLIRISQTGTSASQWITTKTDRKIARAARGEYPGGTVEECEEQKRLISKCLLPDLDDAPHVLVHGDLSGNNIIVDKDQNVQSIIDLSWAEIVPLQFAAEYPRFLTHEFVKTPDGIHWTGSDSAQMKQDRAFYRDCVKERAENEGGFALDYYRILARSDEPWRYWWYTAVSRRDAHWAMAACGWEPPIPLD